MSAAMSMKETLRPDTVLLEQWWNRYIQPGETIEVRITDSRRGPLGYWGKVVGYFTEREAFLRDVGRVTGHDAQNVYATLNPVRAELRARANNRLVDRAKHTAGDADIVQRRHWLLDIDPRRPAGIAATDAEVAAAVEARDLIEAWLTTLGLPPPLYRGMSGSGAMLVYWIDLPNDEVSHQLVTDCLAAVAVHFDNEAICVDTTVANASRLTKIPGTVGAKGDEVPELGRCWRRATADFPLDAAVVPRARLETIAALARAPVQPMTTATVDRTGWKGAEITSALEAHGVRYTVKAMPYGTVYALDRCLTSDEHDDGCAIGQMANGAWWYACRHNSCQGQDWTVVRDLLDLRGRRDRQTPHLTPTARAAAATPHLVDHSGALPFRTARQIADSTPARPDFVVEPWAAKGAITEFDGKIKAAGKTTFLTHLARARVTGTPFLGKPAQSGPVVYLTEQPPATFREALRRADLLDRDDVHVLSWHEVRMLSWEQIAAQAAAFAQQIGALLIVDTLGQFSGVSGDRENTAGDALRSMAPLQIAAAAGLAVIISRHERKAGGDVGDSGRGSSAYSGAVDTIVSLRRSQGDAHAGANVRVLQCLSRFDEVPETLVVELTDSGYVVLGDTAAYAYAQARDKLRAALPATEADAKQGDALADETKVKRSLAYEVLKELVEVGEAARSGQGKKGDPYRFWRKQPAAAGAVTIIHPSTTEIEVVDESMASQKSGEPPDSSTTVGVADESQTRRNGQGASSRTEHSSTTSISVVDERTCGVCSEPLAADEFDWCAGCRADTAAPVVAVS